MKKRTLQYLSFLFIILATTMISCDDAEYGDSEEVGRPATSLAGTKWKVIEQGVKIIPVEGVSKETEKLFITTAGAINVYNQDRLKEFETIQTFDEQMYNVSYYKDGEELQYERFYYELTADSIILNDGVLSVDEKGVALIAGKILTLRTIISKAKFSAILKEAKIDPNISDKHIKEVIYQVRSEKISN